MYFTHSTSNLFKKRYKPEHFLMLKYMVVMDYFDPFILYPVAISSMEIDYVLPAFSYTYRISLISPRAD